MRLGRRGGGEVVNNLISKLHLLHCGCDGVTGWVGVV